MCERESKCGLTCSDGACCVRGEERDDMSCVNETSEIQNITKKYDNGPFYFVFDSYSVNSVVVVAVQCEQCPRRAAKADVCVCIRSLAVHPGHQ